MLIESCYHPEQVVSHDTLRFALQHACITRFPDIEGMEGCWLAATNGRIAMFAPVTLDRGDQLGPVRGDLCVLARRAKYKGSLRIQLGRRHIRTADGTIYPRLFEGSRSLEYPDLTHLMRTTQAAVQPTGWAPFNTAQLTLLFKGLGLETVTMTFCGDHNPCRISCSNNGSFGLVMPLRR